MPSTGNKMRPGDPRWAHGPRNHNWRGTKAGMVAKHGRVKTARGRADHCVWGCQARAYNWANLTGDYDDIWDYAQMCSRCHNRYDAARRSMDPDYRRPPNPRRGTSEKIRAEMRAMHLSGISQVRVAAAFGVSRNQVREALRSGNLPPRVAAILSALPDTIQAGQGRRTKRS